MAQSRVERLQTRLDRTASRVEAADIAVSMAAEEFDLARVAEGESRRSARAAAELAAGAGQNLAEAQRRVGELAAHAYRSGGSVASLGVLLSPSGPQDVLARVSMLRTLAGQRRHTVARMDAARVVAVTLDEAAAEALARQVAATAKLATARSSARQRAAQAQTIFQEQTKTRNRLLAQLAVARRTTVSLERARQTGLADVAAEREAEPKPPVAATLPDPVPNPTTPPDPVPNPTRPTDRTPNPSPSPDRPQAPGSSDGSSTGSTAAGAKALAWARKQLGRPYRWGGAGPDSYDCSGLTMRAWQQSGVLLPHSSRLQYSQVDKIAYTRLRAGDLVFYATDTTDSGTIHHVAMYVGSGQIIEAPYTGATVRITALRRNRSMPYAGRP